jgi:hypothetical protein
MSIDYDSYSHEMLMACDGHMCSQELELTGDWQECINEAKDNGWKIRPEEDGEWKHWCPKCWANKGAETAFGDDEI